MNIFDFDCIQEWGPRLSDALSDLVPAAVRERLRTASVEWMEDAVEAVFESGDRSRIVEATRSWLTGQAVAGYHGSRLSSDEIASVMRNGLLALNPADRINRLAKILSPHPAWAVASARLESTAAEFANGRFGWRDGQAHLTISRGGLLHAFNHYLVEGSEFDQALAVELLGKDARELLQQGRSPVIFTVQVPGERALAVGDRWRPTGEMPGLVRHALEFWAYWLHDPTLEPATERVDFGLMFYETIPAAWIVEATPIDEGSLLETYRR